MSSFLNKPSFQWLIDSKLESRLKILFDINCARYIHRLTWTRKTHEKANWWSICYDHSTKFISFCHFNKGGKHFHAQDVEAYRRAWVRLRNHIAVTLCHQLLGGWTEQRQQQHYAWALLAREVCATNSLFLFQVSISSFRFQRIKEPNRLVKQDDKVAVHSWDEKPKYH